MGAVLQNVLSFVIFVIYYIYIACFIVIVKFLFVKLGFVDAKFGYVCQEL